MDSLLDAGTLVIMGFMVYTTSMFVASIWLICWLFTDRGEEVYIRENVRKG